MITILYNTIITFEKAMKYFTDDNNFFYYKEKQENTNDKMILSCFSVIAIKYLKCWDRELSNKYYDNINLFYKSRFFTHTNIFFNDLINLKKMDYMGLNQNGYNYSNICLIKNHDYFLLRKKEVQEINKISKTDIIKNKRYFKDIEKIIFTNQLAKQLLIKFQNYSENDIQNDLDNNFYEKLKISKLKGIYTTTSTQTIDVSPALFKEFILEDFKNFIDFSDKIINNYNEIIGDKSITQFQEIEFNNKTQISHINSNIQGLYYLIGTMNIRGKPVTGFIGYNTFSSQQYYNTMKLTIVENTNQAMVFNENAKLPTFDQITIHEKVLLNTKINKIIIDKNNDFSDYGQNLKSSIEKKDILNALNSNADSNIKIDNENNKNKFKI